MAARAVALAVAGAALLAMPSAGVAGVRLECTAESRSGAALALDVVAVNAGDEPARDVRPEVVYEHQTYSGEAAALDPGARREWQIPLAPPGAPGTFAATVHVHYVDALGRGSVPVVAQVPAPDGSPSPVRLRLAADPVARVGSATLLIENPDARPIAGRVVVVLAGGLATDPESLPARVAASARTTVPLVLENRAALPPGSYPAYALFEYTASGEHHAAVARADVEVVADAGGRRARPLLVGASALAATLALLAVAWRRARSRSAGDCPAGS